ncbi:MAG: dTDP-4-dehydrorhamnose reductase [Acidobacteriota bacterium]
MSSLFSVPLILGTGGRLGRQAETTLSRLYPATIAATRAEIDITDYFRMRGELERLEPTLVINCAAASGVDVCERQPDLAVRVNSDGAANAARACREVGARFIHVSTDQVFDGNKGSPYLEDDIPRPISKYGASKLEGERRVLKEFPEALVVRTSWLFGPCGGDFVEHVLEEARAGHSLSGVTDQVASPTYTPDLIQALLLLAETPTHGVIHFVNGGTCNRFDFACQVAEAAGLEGGLQRVQLRWKDLGFPASRPSYSALSTTRYRSITSREPRDWKEALAEQFTTSPPGRAAPGWQAPT